MTREEALEGLNLSTSAGNEEIEQAYRRLVRRYPPEFQPEKFRRIDEAYRFLMSLPFMLEKLLGPAGTDEIGKDLFSFKLRLPGASALEDALSEAKREFKFAFLWPASPKNS